MFNLFTPEISFQTTNLKLIVELSCYESKFGFKSILSEIGLYRHLSSQVKIATSAVCMYEESTATSHQNHF